MHGRGIVHCPSGWCGRAGWQRRPTRSHRERPARLACSRSVGPSKRASESTSRTYFARSAEVWATICVTVGDLAEECADHGWTTHPSRRAVGELDLDHTAANESLAATGRPRIVALHGRGIVHCPSALRERWMARRPSRASRMTRTLGPSRGPPVRRRMSVTTVDVSSVVAVRQVSLVRPEQNAPSVRRPAGSGPRVLV